MLRKTRSLALYLQMLGRFSRKHENKFYGICLDHVGNCLQKGFGVYDTIRSWSLNGQVKSKYKKDEIEEKFLTCKKCFAFFPVNMSHCPQCGTNYQILWTLSKWRAN
jgi:superfamily II DNA or RNA helicase